jgi:hypothetical protein
MSRAGRRLSLVAVVVLAGCSGATESSGSRGASSSTVAPTTAARPSTRRQVRDDHAGKTRRSSATTTSVAPNPAAASPPASVLDTPIITTPPTVPPRQGAPSPLAVTTVPAAPRVTLPSSSEFVPPKVMNVRPDGCKQTTPITYVAQIRFNLVGGSNWTPWFNGTTLFPVVKVPCPSPGT